MRDRMGQGNKHLASPLQNSSMELQLHWRIRGNSYGETPLAKEITVRMPKSKSLIHQGASAKTEDLTDPMQETPTTRNEGAQTGQVMP